jgi:hypothetical protein
MSGRDGDTRPDEHGRSAEDLRVAVDDALLCRHVATLSPYPSISSTFGARSISNRGAASLPMSVGIAVSVAAASPIETGSIWRFPGASVVTFGVSGFISPTPLKRVTWTFELLPFRPARILSRAASSRAHVVEGALRAVGVAVEAVLGERVAEDDVVGVLAFDEHVGLAERPRLVVPVLAEQVRIRVGVEVADVALGDREHAARAAGRALGFLVTIRVRPKLPVQGSEWTPSPASIAGTAAQFERTIWRA